MVSKLNDNNFVLQFGNLSAASISQNNPAIARAAGKTPGQPLTVADFKIYVNSIT